MKRALLTTLALTCLGGQAAANSLPLSYWASAERPTYLQVPSYQQYQKVTLLVRPGRIPQGVQGAELWLDGRKVNEQPLSTGETTFHLPDLSPGGHELRLRTLGPVPPGVCAAIGRAVAVQAAELRFTPRDLGPPLLARLPEGLYHPNPAALAVGTMRADTWNNSTLSAALGLAQVLTRRNALLWQAGSAQDLPPDFVVNLVHQPALTVPVRLELKPGKLDVLYRKDAELMGAVSALATPQFRDTLLDANADLGTVQPIPTPRLIPPRTLSEFGVTDYRVWSGQSATQALRLPPMWEPGGPVTGNFQYHQPLPPSGREKVTLRLGRRTLDVSPDAGRRFGNDSVVVPLRGEMVGATDGLTFQVNAENLSSHCDATLRVDSSSTVDFRARRRSGLAGLPRLLAYRPEVTVERRPEAMALALNVAASLDRWGLQGPLNWQASFGSGSSAALTIGTSPAGKETSNATAHLQVHQAPFSEPRVSMTASTEGLRELSSFWYRVPEQLTDNLKVAEVQPGGKLLTGPALAQAQAGMPSGAARRVLLFSLLTLPIAAALWFRRRP